MPAMAGERPFRCLAAMLAMAAVKGLGPRAPRLRVGDAFAGAVLAGDSEAAEQTPADVVDAVRRNRPGLMTWAAAQGAASSVPLLAAAGFDVNAMGRSDIASNDPWHRALHVAAQRGDLALASTLLDLGANPNIRDKHCQSTPLGWARHFRRTALVDLLEPLTG